MNDHKYYFTNLSKYHLRNQTNICKLSQKRSLKD